MKKRIHVNMHKIRFNQKHGTRNPVITVKTSHSNRYAHSVDILGPSTVMYRPDKPLSCGARVWIETEAEFKIACRETRSIDTQQRSAKRLRANDTTILITDNGNCPA